MNKKIPNLIKNILWAIATLVVISIIFSLFMQSSGNSPQQLSLNELVGKINAGQVSSIIVNNDNSLDIKLTNGQKASANKETEASLTQTLFNYGVSSSALQKVNITVSGQSNWQYWAGILVPTLLSLIFFGVIFWLMFRQAKGGVNQAFNFARSGIKMFNPFKDQVTFKDVAGLKEAKEDLEEIVDFLKSPQKFFSLGARIPRGVLLAGLPGTGKTLLARAVAGEAKVPFFYISASEFVEMFVGVGAARTRDVFAVAKKAAPSILFIDEIDAVGRQRGAGLGGGNDEREQTLNQILVELDGFDRETRVVVLAATNRPDILDPALLRPGRFDRRVILDLPDIKDREEILKIHARGKVIGKDVDLQKVAIRTPGFSGADLANILNEAALLAARKKQKEINQLNIYDAVEKVMLGAERRGRVITDKERKITAYHEAGHALTAASLKDADPIQKVSIISRGFAGGYTLKLPIQEEHLRTKNQFLADLAILMGGYVSEKINFKDVSTGASSDLKEASSLARRLVTKYGMSEKLGPITFGNTEEMVFLGREITTEKDYSEAVAEKIDNEVSGFIHYAMEASKKVLAANKEALKAVAEALLKKETLEQEDFNNLLKPFKIKPIGLAYREAEV
ncbi:MAG: ATP-dependent zinc metalloprotease FtsH [Patescibacteria group bacterium]|nr:ATP-dependent zinc metalloprotease FtsH [Patescibacteria group bacterium]